MFWPCETRTSTCRSFATISSGLYRFLAIAVLLDVKDIPQVGPLQWGWIKTTRAFPTSLATTSSLAPPTRFRPSLSATSWYSFFLFSHQPSLVVEPLQGHLV